MAVDKKIETLYGRIALVDQGAGDKTLFLIHGNSSLKEVFAATIMAFRGRYRVVAMDLPGHGASDDATEPDTVYTIPSYARAAQAVISSLELKPVALFGWSLGGHIGMEMIAQGFELAGLALCGAPPVTFSGRLAGKGFLNTPVMALTGKETFSEEEALAYAIATLGDREYLSTELLAGVLRTDGRARKIMFNGFLAKELADEKAVVESSHIPLAILDGSKDVFIDADYIENGPVYANLWSGKRHPIRGAGHAPFLSHPDQFNALLGRFLADVLG